MKTKKLNLNDLKVESFVTSMENESSNTVKGGGAGVVVAVALGSIGVMILSAVAGAVWSYGNRK